MKKMRKLSDAVFNKIITIMILIILFMAALAGLIYISKKDIITNETRMTSTTLKNSIEQSSDLITTKYYYSNVGQRDNSYAIFNMEIPFLTTKSFLITYQGIVMLGIDVSQVEVDINNKSKTITVHCPPVEVLSNVLDEESIEIYDETYSLFNSVSINDYIEFAIEEKQNVVSKMREQGVFEQAEINTANAITSILKLNAQIQEEDYAINVVFAQAADPQEIIEQAKDSILSFFENTEES